MELHGVRLWTFPYTAQPASEGGACGLRVSQGTSDLCTDERAIGAERSRNTRSFLSRFAVSDPSGA